MFFFTKPRNWQALQASVTIFPIPIDRIGCVGTFYLSVRSRPHAEVAPKVYIKYTNIYVFEHPKSPHAEQKSIVNFSRLKLFPEYWVLELVTISI